MRRGQKGIQRNSDSSFRKSERLRISFNSRRWRENTKMIAKKEQERIKEDISRTEKFS